MKVIFRIFDESFGVEIRNFEFSWWEWKSKKKLSPRFGAFRFFVKSNICLFNNVPRVYFYSLILNIEWNYSNCYPIISRMFQSLFKPRREKWCFQGDENGNNFTSASSAIFHLETDNVVSGFVYNLQWILESLQVSFDVQSGMLENSYLQDLDWKMKSFMSSFQR